MLYIPHDLALNTVSIPARPSPSLLLPVHTIYPTPPINLFPRDTHPHPDGACPNRPLAYPCPTLALPLHYGVSIEPFTHAALDKGLMLT